MISRRDITDLYSNRHGPGRYRGFSIAFGSCLCLAVLVAFGCSVESKSRLSSDRLTGQRDLREVLSLWRNGKKDSALEHFLALDWQDHVAVDSLAGMNLSESEFMALSDEERSRIQEEVWPSLKDLATEAVVRGRALEKAGNAGLSKKHLEAVRNLGDRLDSVDSSLLFQHFGKAIKQLYGG